MNYCERLSFYNLEFLEVHRVHNNFIMCKILHSHVPVSINNCISISLTNYTRGNLYKL